MSHNIQGPYSKWHRSCRVDFKLSTDTQGKYIGFRHHSLWIRYPRIYCLLMQRQQFAERNLLLFVCCLVTKLCLTIFNPVDCSQSDSSIHVISQVEYWNGLPFAIPGDLPNPGIESMSPALAWVSGLFTTELPGKPNRGIKEF